MHIAYTPPEARRRVAAEVRAFCADVDALPRPAPARRASLGRPQVWRMIAEAWRHVCLAPANDR